MFMIAMRDLQFRRRRFSISIVAVALIFSLTVVLSGIAASFDIEAENTLADLDVETWIVAEGAAGPFFASSPMLITDYDTVASADGIEASSPIGFRVFTLEDEARTGINVFGIVPGEVGAPTPDEGRQPEALGEAMVDTSLGFDIGESFRFAGVDHVVVGTLSGSTLLAGTANTFVTLEDLQANGFKGAPVITAVAVDGAATDLPDGFVSLTGADAKDDLVRPLADAADTIFMVSVLLWIVAAAIIGSVIYLGVLERVGDFAVFKATGMSTSWVLFGLIFQAVILAVIGSIIALGLALLLLPTLPLPAQLTTQIVVALPVIAIVVAVLASIVGVRRAVSVDPALAFG